ncbi:ATPase family AAA domain-containing protein 3-like [Papaver somniferum]|uniref:ATPase family AAA domain-containing protein 3-like n=1 Tax=Papaver somniferum TaxID=3469 RepID=UPI000E6FEB2E|nr:ATPase family AAA domain-containing protein 3-like [Papaver somniferum]
MFASKITTCAAALTVAAATATLNNPVYADGAFRFSPFSSSSSSSQNNGTTDSKDETSSVDDEPKGGFDPESLESAAKALREINNNRYSKEVFKVMRMQEATRLKESEAEKAEFLARQAQNDIERQRKMAQEQFNLLQQDAQAKAQILRYEDELARKRMQTDHESGRRHNAELVRMQEESAAKQEDHKRAAEEQIQAQLRRTEKENAEIERETVRFKIEEEAKGRALEERLSEDVNRRMLVESLKGETENWLSAINTTFGHIEGGFRILFTDRTKLLMAVGGVTALAAGVYTTREGARVTWGYINRILGQPSLIRESSIAKYPWSGMVTSGVGKLFKKSTTAGGMGFMQNKTNSGSIVLHPSLQRRIEQLARATANTKTHQAPFRNMLFYGPPGTGKTMVAKEIARKSGLDYAMMTGGDVAPLGAEAVTKIHQLFDWAKKSNKGLLLFIDEADAFLCERNSIHMSEAQRSALNALLFRTGDQSRDIVLVLATNRPGDLDSAITDRMDEVIEFPLPGVEERFKLLNLYLKKYLETEDESGLKLLLKKKPKQITVKDLSEDQIWEAARKTDGFSGREIAKLVASIQAAVYGQSDCALDSHLFKEIVDYKVAEHHRRKELVV